MKLDIDDMRDIIERERLRVADEDLTPEEALDNILEEIDRLEIESF